MTRDTFKAKGEPLLPREPDTERALSWANQHGYSFAASTLNSYCAARGLTWESDSMYEYVTFTETE